MRKRVNFSPRGSLGLTDGRIYDIIYAEKDKESAVSEAKAGVVFQIV